MLWLFLVGLTVITGALFYILALPSLKNADSKSKSIMLAVTVMVPLVALLIYQQRGASDEVALVQTLAGLNEESTDGSLQPLIDFQRDLEKYTRDNPDEAEYWFILASMRMDMQDFDGAVDAYQSASELLPEDISLHARLAEAQFLADGYLLTEAVREHIDIVLAEDPNDTTVLGILGITAFRAEQYEAAIQFWQRSLQALPPFSPAAESIRASIEQAQIAGGLVTQEPGPESPAVSGISFDVAVSLKDSITAESSDTVFVFARQFNGPPMPVVVQRITVGDLPARLRLDDSKVMIEGRKLADFEQLELVARLSYSGQPTAQSGDYEVVIGPVNPTEISETIQLQIAEPIQ